MATNGILEQHVDDSMEIELDIIDLADLSQSDRATRIKQFLYEFALAGRNLAVGLPIAVTLIRMSSHESLLAWGIHHTSVDGIGYGIVLQEFWSEYSALLQQRQPQLVRTPVRYLDYARWQHATHHEWMRKHSGYWRNRMAGNALLGWPVDTSVAEHERGNVMLEVVGMPTLEVMRRVARSFRTTPAMLVLTIYAAIVARWCGCNAFTVPVNAAGRHRPDLEHAAGYFAQFLFVSIRITEKDTFLELLARVSGEFRDALTHQDFGRIAKQIPNVLLGSMFSWVPWNNDVEGLPSPSTAKELGLTVRRFPFTQPATLLEFRGIGAFFSEANEKYAAGLWYRTDVFSGGMVEQFSSEFRQLCERVITNPHCLVAATHDG